jgi:hypothetical protein
MRRGQVIHANCNTSCDKTVRAIGEELWQRLTPVPVRDCAN